MFQRPKHRRPCASSVRCSKEGFLPGFPWLPILATGSTHGPPARLPTLNQPSQPAQATPAGSRWPRGRSRGCTASARWTPRVSNLLGSTGPWVLGPASDPHHAHSQTKHRNCAYGPLFLSQIAPPTIAIAHDVWGVSEDQVPLKGFHVDWWEGTFLGLGKRSQEDNSPFWDLLILTRTEKISDLLVFLFWSSFSRGHDIDLLYGGIAGENPCKARVGSGRSGLSWGQPVMHRPTNPGMSQLPCKYQQGLPLTLPALRTTNPCESSVIHSKHPLMYPIDIVGQLGLIFGLGPLAVAQIVWIHVECLPWQRRN